jgi:hypothetical protein
VNGPPAQSAAGSCASGSAVMRRLKDQARTHNAVELTVKTRGYFTGCQLDTARKFSDKGLTLFAR